MSSLVLDLQKEALDPSISTLSLLRKALVVATKLKLEDFKEWTESEINGYIDGEIIPDYRRVRGETKYWNQYHGWQPIIFDEDVDFLNVRELQQPVSELAHLVQNPNQILILKYGTEYEREIMRYFSIGVQPTLHISQACIFSLLETIRVSVLKWSLHLEDIGIIGQGMTFSVEEKSIATQNKLEINNYINMNQIQNSNQDNTKVNQKFYGSVGAVQNGNENISHVNQVIGSDNAKILRAITELREMVNILPLEKQELALDALDTLQSETGTPTKRVKIESALLVLWNVSQKVASFANAVTAIAQRFGIDFNS